MKKVKIIGTGSYLPRLRIRTEELIKNYGLNADAEKVKNVVGIHFRHWCDQTETTSTMGAIALQRAMENSHIKAGDLTRIILGTSTADHTNLSSANKIQKLVGASCPAVDVVNACSSFMFALDYAILAANEGDYIAVVGADTKSRFVNKNDQRFLPIFGDGAAAWIVKKNKGDSGFGIPFLYTDGTKYDLLLNPAGGSALPASYETVENGLHATNLSDSISGLDLVSEAVDTLSYLTKRCLYLNNKSANEVDFFVFHQANALILKGVQKKLGLCDSQLAISIEHTGNIVSACIPYTYNQLVFNKQISKGQKVVFASAGAGSSGGSFYYEE